MPPKTISPSDAQLLLEGLHHVTSTITIYLPDLATQKDMKTHALAERFRVMAKRYGLNLKTTTVGSASVRRPARESDVVKKEEESFEPVERAPRRAAAAAANAKRKYAEEAEEEGDEGLREAEGKQRWDHNARAVQKTVETVHGSDVGDADLWGEDGGRAMTESDLEGSE